MKRGPMIALWCAATLLVSAGTSWWWHRLSPAHDKESELALHLWMHEHLEITPEQDVVLDPFEQAYEKERQQHRAEIRAAGLELAAAVQSAPGESPAVTSALTRLSQAQSALQQATLKHFFQMKAHLRPDQQTKLLQWTHDSLLSDHGH